MQLKEHLQAHTGNTCKQMLETTVENKIVQVLSNHCFSATTYLKFGSHNWPKPIGQECKFPKKLHSSIHVENKVLTSSSMVGNIGRQQLVGLALFPLQVHMAKAEAGGIVDVN